MIEEGGPDSVAATGSSFSFRRQSGHPDRRGGPAADGERAARPVRGRRHLRGRAGILASMSRVLFVVPARVHLLDLAGPAQAFSAAVDEGADYQLAYVGEQAVVASHQGLPLHVCVDWPALTAADTVVVPGCRVGSQEAVAGLGAGSLERIAAHHAAGGRVASVCSGAFALAEAHLLDGRRATTHHDVQDELARRFPAVKVVPDVLYVVDDRVATSAGVASGI